MTTAVVENETTTTETPKEFKVKHGACNLCAEWQPGDPPKEVTTFCGVRKTLGADTRVGPPDKDCCVVCIELSINHVMEVHGRDAPW